MEKMINIGGAEKLFRATGATPIKYRRAFPGADFFRDISAMGGLDPDNMSDEDMEGIEKIAFVMCEDSALPGLTFEKWLDQFGLFDVFGAIPDIMELLTANLETQAITGSSKNAERAES